MAPAAIGIARTAASSAVTRTAAPCVGHRRCAGIPADGASGARRCTPAPGDPTGAAERGPTRPERAPARSELATRIYLIVEAMGGGARYFRAFSATDLGGTFTAIPGASTEATPFAGKNNVTFTGSAWTNDISHGDMVRDDPSETQTIDPGNMQLLYQGRDPSINVGYGELQYRPGLLTKTN